MTNKKLTAAIILITFSILIFFPSVMITYLCSAKLGDCSTLVEVFEHSFFILFILNRSASQKPSSTFLVLARRYILFLLGRALF